MGEKKGVRTKEEGARKGGRRVEGEGDRQEECRVGRRKKRKRTLSKWFYHLPILLIQHRQTSKGKK